MRSLTSANNYQVAYRLCFVLVLCVLHFGSLHTAPDFPFRFRYLTTDDGLSQNTVDFIYRDSRGFMWFATWNGLCRYDGYEFEVFRSVASQRSLPSNFVHSLVESPDGLLWVGTSEGLIIYDLDHGRFLELAGLPESLSQLRINALHSTTNGQIFVGTATNGYYVLTPSPRSGPATALKVEVSVTGLAGEVVNTFHPASEHAMLIGTNGGLWRHDASGRLARETLTSIGNPRVLSVLNGKQYSWIGTDTGLIRRHRSTGEERHYQSNTFGENDLAHNTVTSLARDVAGNLLIGTLGGLHVYRSHTDDFLRITEAGPAGSALNNPFINSIFADPIGNVWIGTEKGGINQYNLHQHRFGTILHSEEDDSSLSSGKVNSILPEGRQLWVGTAGGGLNKINERGEVIRVYRKAPDDSRSISNNFITSLLRDMRGNLWQGTWGGGLNRLDDASSGTFSTIPGLASIFVSSLYEDVTGLLLIGTENGLDLFNPTTETITHLNASTIGVEISEVGCILLDRQDDYWVGTRRGLYRFPARKIREDHLNLTAADVQFYDREDDLLPGNYVLSLFETDDGTLWVGTYGNGLARITRNGCSMKSDHFNEEDGLCNNVVYAIQEDNKGELWLSTDHGLSCFNPRQEQFKNYFTIDGLPSNQFYWSASAADARGNLYFGSIEGLLSFNPEKISNYPAQPEAVLAGLTAMGETVHPGQERHGRPVLTTTLDRSERIELSYLDNAFTLEFTALDYFLSEKIRFAYRMDGVDQDWVTVPASRRFASYTNLAGGDYLFEVKASNGEGKWQEEPTRLGITIHPPFWRTSWFRFLLIVLALGTVFAYIWWRTRYLEQQTRKLERLVRQRTSRVARQKDTLERQATSLRKSNDTLEHRQREIAAQKAELETKNAEISSQRDQLIAMNAQVRKVNELRLRFFTNVSHEFRTPLTLIIDPVRELMGRLKDQEQVHGTLSIVHRNARRLLHLVNQLMDLRFIEEGRAKLHLTQADPAAFLRGVGESFRSLARKRRMDYRLDLPDGERLVWFDAEKVEHVVYNLLSNAFKYTPAGGSVRLVLTVDQLPGNDHPESFTVTVEDNGVGIDAEALNHIFDPFYRVPGATGNGSGVGLSLTREMVTLHHGTIQVESQPGEGATFRVALPCTEEAFRPEELSTEGKPALPNLAGRLLTLRKNLERMDYGQQAEKPIPPASSDKPTILLVEDHADLRMFLANSLESEFRVIEAADGREGYDLARRFSPEVIISDIMMPGMNGMELCQKIKSQMQTSHIPIILLTAKVLPENILEGLEQGADDYLTKPCNPVILRAKIRTLVQSRRQLKRMFARSETPEPAQVTTTPLDREFIEKLYALLADNYMEASFTQDDLAEGMFVSRSQLYKKIRSLMDMSVTDFINRYKINRAMELMDTGALNVSEVAYSTGFTDPKYFSRIFKKYQGMSPSQFVSAKSFQEGTSS